MTSTVGIAPMPLVAAYTASKYAIEGCRRMLRTYAEEMSAILFKRSSDYNLFSDETCALANLAQPGIKPDMLVTDYYLNGGFINGLKLIRHAKTMIPGICTILVG